MHRLHHLGPVDNVGETLVDFQERSYVLDIPQVRGGRLTLDLTVHRVFEQDGTKDTIAVECGTGHDPRAHFVDDREHFFVVGPGVFGNTVKTQRLGRAAATLVEGRNKSGGILDFGELFCVAHDSLC